MRDVFRHGQAGRASVQEDDVAVLDELGSRTADECLLLFSLLDPIVEGWLCRISTEIDHTSVNFPHDPLGLELFEVPPDGHHGAVELRREFCNLNSFTLAQQFENFLLPSHLVHCLMAPPPKCKIK